jgi:hypothetical protein
VPGGGGDKTTTAYTIGYMRATRNRVYAEPTGANGPSTSPLS